MPFDIEQHVFAVHPEAPGPVSLAPGELAPFGIVTSSDDRLKSLAPRFWILLPYCRE
jgi:hypothetical protein